MNTVFDPTVMFISDTDWQDSKKQDAFLNHLLNNLKHIVEYGITKIYWTEELEEFLWNHPQLPPWRIDRDWKLQIVPVIYKLFNNCRILTEISEETADCRIQPPLKIICSKKEIHKSFIQLVHVLIGQQGNVFFCVGIGNILPDGKRYIFDCNCHSYVLSPLQINESDQWFWHIDLESDYFWPSAYCEEENKKFKKAINITAKTEFSKNIDDGFVYEYEFSNEFIKDISQESDRKMRKQVLYSISKRLMHNQKSASSEKGLKDEPVKGKQNLRRFRVTGENRIHYLYSDRGNIVFLNYYRSGQHDNGL